MADLTSNVRTYRKKPIDVKAYLWDGNINLDLPPGTIYSVYEMSEGHIYGKIRSREGELTIRAGEHYIVGPGAKGEYWPVEREIFEATYEEFSGDSSAPETKAGRHFFNNERCLWCSRYFWDHDSKDLSCRAQGSVEETSANVRDSIAPNIHCPVCDRWYWADKFDGHKCVAQKASAPLCKCGRRSPHRFVEGECGEVKASGECTCPGGSPDGPLGWSNNCRLHGFEGRNRALTENGKGD